MEPINVNLSCDLQNPVKVQYLDGYFFSKDSAGHKINVDVFNNGVPVSIGGSVSADVIRSDGETVPVTGTVSENRAYVILPQAAYAVVGAAQITIKVTEGTTIVTIASFVVYVHESDTGIIVDPGTIIPSIQALISQIETAVASIPADYSSLWTSLAPAFSTSTAYAVGQYVTNSGVLYRFTTAHPAGTWNSAHVTAVNLGADVSDLKSAIINNTQAQLLGTDISFNSMGDYVQCAGTAQDGSINPANKSRVANFDLFNVPNEIVINAKTGFRFYLKIFNQSDILVASTSFVTNYIVAKNHKIRIVIARTSEDAAEIANIAEFTSAITARTFALTVTDDLENSIDLVSKKQSFTAANVVTGSFVYGSSGDFAESANYVRTDYIQIPEHVENTELKAYCSFVSGAGIAFYTDEKRYISGISGNDASTYGFNAGTETRLITIPIQAKYVAMTLVAELYNAPDDFDLRFTKIVQAVKYDDSVLTAEDFSYTGFSETGEAVYPTDIGQRVCSRFIKAEIGDKVVSSAYYVSVAEYDEDFVFKTKTSTWEKLHRVANKGYIKIMGLCGSRDDIAEDVTIYKNGTVINESLKDTSYDYAQMSRMIGNEAFGRINPLSIPGATRALANDIIKTVGHRGYRLGVPENTLPAFAMARKVGLYAIETDVQFTAPDSENTNGVPVMLHDFTVNRTSNGTGTLSEMTFAQVRELDFGSWMSSDFTGTKIPTFEETLSLCRKLGLSIQLEPKQPEGSQFTTNQFDILFDLIRKYNMQNYIIWTGVNDTTQQQYLLNEFPNATLVLSSLLGINQGVIDIANEMKTETNTVIISTDVSYITDEGAALCRDNGYPLQLIFVVNDTQILNANPYAEWIMTDGVNANDVLYKNAMQVLES